MVVAMFKTTSTPKPASAPLITANTALEQDKATVLSCWLAMGSDEDMLRRKYYSAHGAWRWREKPSEDVSD